MWRSTTHPSGCGVQNGIRQRQIADYFRENSTCRTTSRHRGISGQTFDRVAMRESAPIESCSRLIGPFEISTIASDWSIRADPNRIVTRSAATMQGRGFKLVSTRQYARHRAGVTNQGRDPLVHKTPRKPKKKFDVHESCRCGRPSPLCNKILGVLSNCSSPLFDGRHLHPAMSFTTLISRGIASHQAGASVSSGLVGFFCSARGAIACGGSLRAENTMLAVPPGSSTSSRF